MTTVANQKTIKIQKEECSRNNKYSMYNLEAQQAAMIDLKGETLKMWYYLGKNQNGYEFALSMVDAIKWGIGSKSSYNRAIAELKEKGYLVETSPNHFDFYEIPQQDKEMIIRIVKE